MKKYFIYQDGKGDYFLAKTNKCKLIGKLVGEFKAELTTEPISVGWNKGSVLALINGEKVKINTYKFY